MQILWFPVFLVLFEACIYASTDMFLPGIVTFMKEFVISKETAQLTISIYLLGQGALSLIAGPLSDHFGRKRILLLGSVIFIAATLLCSYTNNISMFLLGRFFQGSSVGFMGVGYAAINESYSSKKAVRITAVMGAIAVLAISLSPSVGAFIIEMSSWRAVFWGLLGGAIISMFGLAYTMNKNSPKHPSSVMQVLQGYKNLLMNTNFVCFSLINTAGLSAFFIWTIPAAFIIIQQLGKSPSYLGLIQSYVCVSLILGNLMVRSLVIRYEISKIIKFAVSLFFIGSLLTMLTSAARPNSVVLIASCMLIAGTGSSMLFAPSWRLVLESSSEPMGRKAALSATIQTGAVALIMICVASIKIKTFFGLSLGISCSATCSVLLFLMLEKRKAIKFISNE